MGNGWLRRAARRGRVRRIARRNAGTAVNAADGRRYKVVAVDEAEETEFADPPRKWGRVGAMAAVWAVVLALGAWVAPAFAASGSDQNEDPRDQPATDAEGAALRYLRYGSSEDLEQAEAALCDGAEPELTPADLDAIRQSYAEALGGITDVSVSTDAPVFSAEGQVFGGTVNFISQGGQRAEHFKVSVKEVDGAFCVFDAESAEPDEPGEHETDEAVDPEGLANDFLTSIVGARNPQAATDLQCEPFTGITADELDQAVTDWTGLNGWRGGLVRNTTPVESNESSITMFEIEVELQGEIATESYSFQVGVQGDCVDSLQGGNGLIEASGD